MEILHSTGPARAVMRVRDLLHPQDGGEFPVEFRLPIPVPAEENFPPSPSP